MYKLNFYLIGLALLNSASVDAFLPTSFTNKAMTTSQVSNIARFSTMEQEEKIEYVVRPDTDLPEDAAEVIKTQAQNYKNYSSWEMLRV